MYETTPLGATPTPDGVLFGLRSDLADAVEVCLFDGTEEIRFGMERVRDGVFSTHVPGIEPGSVYGFRVQGPWDPKAGQRCNAAKLVASRRSVLTRSPTRRGLRVGDTTQHTSPFFVR